MTTEEWQLIAFVLIAGALLIAYVERMNFRMLRYAKMVRETMNEFMRAANEFKARNPTFRSGKKG